MVHLQFHQLELIFHFRSTTSYIDGPVTLQIVTGTEERVLPIGKNGVVRQIGITPTETSTSYTTEFFDSDPQQAYGSQTGTNVAVVSILNYWTVTGSTVQR